MTASSSYHEQYHPYYGRLNEERGEGLWCADVHAGSDRFLQVDMGAKRMVCAVATRGTQKQYASYTTRFRVA